MHASVGAEGLLECIYHMPLSVIYLDLRGLVVPDWSDLSELSGAVSNWLDESLIA